MGSRSSEEGRYDNEQPHTNRVGEFWLGETEVTVGQWQAVMGSNPSYFRSRTYARAILTAGVLNCSIMYWESMPCLI